MTKVKRKDYAKFTYESLTFEYQPLSKSKVAREGIDEFGYEKFGHTNTEAVVRRYVREPFDQFAETDGNHQWVYYKTYKPLDGAALSAWYTTMSNYHINEKQAALAFYKTAQGEDITEELANYRSAMKAFKMMYGDVPINVRNWRLKTEYWNKPVDFDHWENS